MSTFCWVSDGVGSGGCGNSDVGLLLGAAGELLEAFTVHPAASATIAAKVAAPPRIRVPAHLVPTRPDGKLINAVWILP